MYNQFVIYANIDLSYPCTKKWNKWKQERIEKEQTLKERILYRFNKLRDILLLSKYQQPIHPYHES